MTLSEDVDGYITLHAKRRASARVGQQYWTLVLGFDGTGTLYLCGQWMWIKLLHSGVIYWDLK